MDAIFAACKLTPDLAMCVFQEEKSREGFTDGTEKNKRTAAIIFWIFYLIVVVLIGAWAAYLSWTSNSLVYTNTFVKVFFAFFAFMFGTTYLFIYLICKWDLVAGLRKHMPKVEMMSIPRSSNTRVISQAQASPIYTIPTPR